jgi:hypothetical protein
MGTAVGLHVDAVDVDDPHHLDVRGSRSLAVRMMFGMRRSSRRPPWTLVPAGGRGSPSAGNR